MSEEVRRRLEEERSRLLRLRDELAAELIEAQGDPSITTADFAQHPGDLGTDLFEQTRDVSLKGQLETRLQDIDHAFQRLEDGGYGTCESCGQPIGDERLEARPEARFCIEHQEAAERADREERGLGVESPGLDIPT
jgi:DnaK suppressor protein